ncbi:MAG: YqzK family protein [Bacillus sp. (in: firmicutes)]
MKAAVSAFLHTLKVFVIFVCFTILFFIGMVWLNKEYEDYNRYDEPQGTSVKVSSVPEPAEMGWFERLKLFYWSGE